MICINHNNNALCSTIPKSTILQSLLRIYRRMYSHRLSNIHVLPIDSHLQLERFPESLGHDALSLYFVPTIHAFLFRIAVIFGIVPLLYFRFVQLRFRQLQPLLMLVLLLRQYLQLELQQRQMLLELVFIILIIQRWLEHVLMLLL